MVKKKRLEALFNPDLVPDNYAGNEDVAKKAKMMVIDLLEAYDNQRNILQGNQQINITARWDELYRIYRAIYDVTDHNYDGNANVMFPVARRSVNIIESEASNALFSRDDYFSVEAEGNDPDNVDMARRAFQILKYYSDNEGYVDEYELANKQCLIYGCTAVENRLQKDEYKGMYRALKEVPELDEQTGQPKIDLNTQKPMTRKEYKIIEETGVIERPRIEALDIYRLYINMFSNDPEKEDIIYRDSISSQTLIKLAEQGVYNADAVSELIKSPSTWDKKPFGRTAQDGAGKTVVSEAQNQNQKTDNYEVLRFQGLFTIEDEEKGERLQKQFWIDIGERKHVLRVQENPLLGGFKTFSLVNYDSMISEFYTDGVIDPIKAIQYEIDDKENQSLDGVSNALNAPVLMLKSAGIKRTDVSESRYIPHKIIETRDMNALQKQVVPINLGHLNSELQRLNSIADNVTGAVSATAGIPTGTQADRSGKALGILQGQARSQFSKFIRKVERRLIERSLNKMWQIIMQFVDDSIEIELLGENGEKSTWAQRVPEIVGKFNIRVRGGSEYLKEKDNRESMLEFMSVLGMNEAFMQAIDPIDLLKDIAKASPRDYSKYIKPDNLYQKQRSQIQQLTQLVEQLQAMKAPKTVTQKTMGGEQTQEAMMGAMNGQ